MNKVLGGLFLGNYRDSKDVAQLQRHRITHILAIHDAPRRLFPDKEYLCIMASDSPYQNLSQYFPACNDFIHSGRTTNGGNVLIHCLAGMSRSVTIAIAYLMSITSFPLGEAEKIVRGARAVSNPNTGFMKQLQEFEASPRLFEERRRMLEKYPGSTFLENDAEFCKKHLASYNHLITHQHPIKTSPRKIPATPTSLARRDSNLSDTSKGGSVTELAGPSPKRSNSTPNSPAPSSRSEGSRRSSPASHVAGTSPETNAPWERHYGCWKEHFRAKNSGSSPMHTINSTPPSPVHYRVNPTHSRTDSVSSLASVTSLPAHLTPGRDTALLNRRPSISAVGESPDRRRRRRQLPQPRYPTPGGSRDLRTGEEEDETLTVVLVDEPSVSNPESRWPVLQTSSPATSERRVRVQQDKISRSLAARASMGITRWVMKRSGAFRYSMDNA